MEQELDDEGIVDMDFAGSLVRSYASPSSHGIFPVPLSLLQRLSAL